MSILLSCIVVRGIHYILIECEIECHSTADFRVHRVNVAYILSKLYNIVYRVYIASC